MFGLGTVSMCVFVKQSQVSCTTESLHTTYSCSSDYVETCRDCVAQDTQVEFCCRVQQENSTVSVVSRDLYYLMLEVNK